MVLMIISISNNLYFQCRTNLSHNMESEIAQYVTRAENAELQIQDLVKELEALEKGIVKKDQTKPVISESGSKPPKPGTKIS